MGFQYRSQLPRRGLITALLFLAVPAHAVNPAPNCSEAFAVPDRIWPPDHKFATVGIDGVTDADGDGVEIAVRCIMQDEPLNRHGDGHTHFDAQGLGSAVARLRRERAGGGNGRVYHIGFQAFDPSGAGCNGLVKVEVAHDKKAGAIDDGPRYVSAKGSDTRLCDPVPSGGPPRIVSTAVTEAVVDTLYEYDVDAVDPDGDPLEYSLTDAPDGMQIDTHSGLIEWTPDVTQVGAHPVTVIVREVTGEESFPDDCRDDDHHGWKRKYRDKHRDDCGDDEDHGYQYRYYNKV